ncbi:hypothetical protein PQX77_019008 [Marasmius sp. AFHP31]|nr:hypothetical protein PQX77_019008 [Marasmius sp. AFHP31]
MSSTQDLEKLESANNHPHAPAPVHFVDGRRDSKVFCYNESVQYKEVGGSTATFPQSIPDSSPLHPTESHQPHQHRDRRERRRAWCTVFGGFLALFCTFGQMNAFGTFQTYYAGHQLNAHSPSTISWIGSLQLWVFFCSVCVHATVIRGILADVKS